MQIDLDQVQIDPRVFESWLKVALDHLAILRRAGGRPDQIGTEYGVTLPDGSLRVVCDVSAPEPYSLTHRVPFGRWTWAGPLS